jgi:hypothetical protein
MTKPQCNGRYASGYVYVYANDMLAVMPAITPTTTPHLVTPVATLTAMPMNMSMATSTNFFHGGLYVSKIVIET